MARAWCNPIVRWQGAVGDADGAGIADRKRSEPDPTPDRDAAARRRHAQSPIAGTLDHSAPTVALASAAPT